MKRQKEKVLDEEDLEKEITKEYDINVILEKAREEKKVSYEEEKHKKLKDTQLDILKSLNLDKYQSINNENVEDENNLESLINTITLNEKNSSATELDILSDLRGSGDTEVLDGLKEDISDELIKTINMNTNLININNETEDKLDNSFYTSSNALKTSDFDDSDDFSKSIESNNIFLKIIIAIIILVFIVGLVLIINSIYFS